MVPLSDLERKVKAVESFLPGAKPVPSLEECDDAPDDLPFRMAIHRDIMRGTGFYDTMQRPNDISHAMATLRLDETAPSTLSLPSFDYLGIKDPVLRNAVLEIPLPEDRARMEQYASNRSLGVALIAAPAGTGKTTALVALALGGLYSSAGGKVYGSGPTNTAVTNFAHRFYAVGTEFARRCNNTAPDKVVLTYRRPLVVRGYSKSAEVEAFINVLKSGNANDTAYRSRTPSQTPRWQLSLSAANWLLAVLCSKSLACTTVESAVKELDPAHASFLYELRAEYDAAAATNGPLKRLVQVARGEMTWQEYSQDGTVPKEFVARQMQRIINAADAVLTTPAGAQNAWYRDAWSTAKVIAIDDAGCMSQADLRSIWGNTLRPITLAGDVKQLPPTMIELKNRDANDNAMNRFALAGTISGLAWLQALGIPTFRLLRQIRMANNMFGLAQKLFYDEHSIEYGPGSDPSLARHDLGCAFEAYFAKGLFKGYKAPPKGTLQPLFLHMPDTRIVQVGSSRLNRAQVKRALDLVDDFVKQTNAPAEQFVIITAHRPNLEYGNRLLEASYPALAGMPAIQTVDTIQGSENTISILILGTSSDAKSVGFISNENRLNVSLTRQKSGLLIVGDKTVTGKLTGTKAQMVNLMKQAKNGKISWNKAGEMTFTKTSALRKVLVELHRSGRIIESVTQERSDEMAVEEEKKLAEEERKILILKHPEEEWTYDTHTSWADIADWELDESSF